MSPKANEELGTGGIGVVGSGHREHSGDVRSGVKFGANRIPGAARAGTRRTASLNHESVDNTVKCDTVVETDPSQPDEIGTVPGSGIRQQIQQNRAVVSFEFDAVVIAVEIDVLHSGVDFGFAITAHGDAFEVSGRFVDDSGEEFCQIEGAKQVNDDFAPFRRLKFNDSGQELRTTAPRICSPRTQRKAVMPGIPNTPMDTNTPFAAPAETPSVPAVGPSQAAQLMAPRLWPAWVICVGLAAALALTVTPSIANKPRFFLMMGGPFLGGLLFSVWLLFLSGLRWSDRLRLAGLGAMLPFAAGFASDSGPALRTAMWVYGVPLAVFAVTSGLTCAGRQPHGWRLAAGLLAAGWFSFALVRNEGFDGEYYPEFAWRWSAEHESTLPLLGNQPGDRTEPAETPAGSESATPAAPAITAVGWPGYRGPFGDGIADDTVGELDWRVTPPEVLWKISVGPAWSSFAWHDGRLFTQEQRREEECITCYSDDDGRLIWSQASASRFTEVVSGAGPRSTPAVHGGRVFALGGRGLLTCLNEADGSLLWQKDLAQTIGARVPMWGFSGSPFPVGDRIVVFADGDGTNGLIAVDSSTGEIVWGFESRGMNYTTVRDFDLCGQRCLVFCDGRGVHGLNPDNGAELFSYRPSKWNAGPMVDPQQLGPAALLVSLGDGVGLCRLNLEYTGGSWKFAEAWTTSRLRPSFNDSLVHGGSIYGFNQDLLCCIDAATGDLQWRGKRYGFGQAVLLKNAGCLLLAAENGDAVLVKASGDGFEELGRVPVLDDKTWNHPIVVGDRAYLRNGRTAAAISLHGTVGAKR